MKIFTYEITFMDGTTIHVQAEEYEYIQSMDAYYFYQQGTAIEVISNDVKPVRSIENIYPES